MDIIKSIDLCGSQVHLNIKGNLYNKTLLGGFLTILLILVFLFLFVLLGRSLYKREKPLLTSSIETPSSYLNFTLNSSTFLFAFRSDTQDGQTVNIPEMFYFETRYIVYRKYSDQETIKVTDKMLTYRKCEIDDFNNNTIYHTQSLKNWYCFDWPKEGLTVGGLHQNELIQYIKIKMFHCDRAPQNYLIENNITCSKNKTYLKNIFRSPKYFSVIIQSLMIDADKYNEPFTLNFNNLYNTLDLAFTKKVYYYMKMGILRDNKGWFFDEIEETLLYGLDRMKYDILNQDNDILDRDYYECNLYFDNIKEKYERKYEKVQDLIAQLGGLMKSFSMIISIFLSLYNTYHRDIFIINNSFDFYSKSSILKLRKNISNDNIINNDETNKSIVKIEEETNKELIRHLCKNIMYENKFINSKKINYINKKRKNNKIDDNSFEVNFIPSVKLKIGYFNFIKSLFCRLNEYKNKQLYIFKQAHKIMLSRLDVINIIKNFQKLETITEILFDDEGVNKLNKHKRLYFPD